MRSKEEICAALAQDIVALVDLLSTPNEPQAGVKLYTFAELGKMMGKSKDTIRQWACAGQFGEPVRVGQSIRVTQAGLDQFLADHSGPIQKRRTPKKRIKAGFNPSGEPFGI